MLCGAAASFGQLFLTRIGVGVGEAGGTPPAHSIISEYFGQHERAFAISVYSLGIAFGSLFGLMLGGIIAELYGWRMAFIAAGAPGLVVALVLKISVDEPSRDEVNATGAGQNQAQEPRESLINLFTRLWNIPAYRFVTIAHVLAVFVAYALSAWLPTYSMRYPS